MPSVIPSAIRKTRNRDSTILINSLLRTSASSVAFTDEEQIAAGFLAFINCPLKMGYGFLLVVGGILLSPLPSVVVTIHANESTDKNGTRLDVRHVGFTLGQALGDYTREEFEDCPENKDMVNTKQVTGTYLNIGLDLSPDPDGTLPEELDSDYINTNKLIIGNVSGLNLAKAGVGRIVAGACEPLVGIYKIAFFSVKKAFVSFPSNHSMTPPDNTPRGNRM